MDEYIENHDVGINFHGIEMRGLNEDSHAIYSYQNQEVHELMTKCGFPLRVYIQRGSKSTALITFHDIGTNHDSFRNFFNSPEMMVLLDNFTVYNISAPGHHSQESKMSRCSQTTDEKFRLLSSSKSIDDNDGDIYTINRDKFNFTTYPSMDTLAEMIDSVVEYFRLTLFLGMGVGAGANVMARYGMKYSSKLMGLFLINPDDMTSGYIQWARARWSALPSLRSGQMTEWLEEYLLEHWFGSAEQRILEIQEHYLQSMRDMNYPAVAGYIEAYMNRAALGLVRSASDQVKGERCIDVETFLVTGDSAADKTDTMANMNGNMNPSKTQFLSIPDCSGMVLEEAPGKLANIFLNFLRNLGILVTMTNDKLQKAALTHQTNGSPQETGTLFMSQKPSDRC